MVRGFYALGDCATPVRVAAVVVALNLALNLTLIWTPLARGRAGRLDRHLGRRRSAGPGGDLLPLSGPAPGPRRWRPPPRGRVLATLLMALAAAAALHWIPPAPGALNASPATGRPHDARRRGLLWRLLALRRQGVADAPQRIGAGG